MDFPDPAGPFSTINLGTAWMLEVNVQIMGVVAELILIRHGQSLANVAFAAADEQDLLEIEVSGRDAEVPLTDLGVEQAEAVGAWLAALPADRRPEVVVTSPYLRARETWRIAADAAGVPLPRPRTDDRLVDRLLGDLEMLTRAAVAARFPGEAARLAEAGLYEYRPPGGESFADMRIRLSSFLEDLHREHPDRRVVVVAHDAVVLMARAVLENLDWAGVAAVEESAGSVRNASISRFRSDGGNALELDRYNVIDHLS
ncbi:histidine phosphatase family protein [Actinoplanes oblitus]|uniref:Histidine phosphatase family protein n=1 Tax=Actinoplanes oblitus TaxID=3040509 RepID=A0ABY8WPK8_9ACTN|nr:histidine phosphatase family protein [Actinoplanes oblitus]WIM98249.1 histidine phosphatase family protein [Actinoplanes oblitus]